LLPDERELRELEGQLADEFPTLRVERRELGVWVLGSLPLIESGVEIARYNIEIEIPANPRDLPKVREVGGKIPHAADRHINRTDGLACLFVPDERWRHYPIGSSLIEFIRKPLREFFLWQAYYDLEGKPLFPARSHEAAGVLESYCDELQTNDPSVVIKFLDYLGSKRPKGHWDCYCGSRRRLRDCHFAKLLSFREKIPREYAQRSFNLLRAWLSTRKQMPKPPPGSQAEIPASF
jgi:hypothetical protein